MTFLDTECANNNSNSNHHQKKKKIREELENKEELLM